MELDLLIIIIDNQTQTTTSTTTSEERRIRDVCSGPAVPKIIIYLINNYFSGSGVPAIVGNDSCPLVWRYYNARMRLQSNACLIFKLFDNEMNFLFVWEIESESVGLSDRPGSMPLSMVDREYPYRRE